MLKCLLRNFRASSKMRQLHALKGSLKGSSDKMFLQVFSDNLVKFQKIVSRSVCVKSSSIGLQYIMTLFYNYEQIANIIMINEIH